MIFLVSVTCRDYPCYQLTELGKIYHESGISARRTDMKLPHFFAIMKNRSVERCAS